MPVRILILGLPGSGKTTLATALVKRLDAEHFNADDVRQRYNDWDFSEEGRMRQSRRMRILCDTSQAEYVIADFVCPLPEMRDNFAADWTIWVDTIKEGRFEDTNRIFIPPAQMDFHVTTQDCETWADLIAGQIIGR